MLGKLIKYEFRASGRLIPLVYAVVALLGVTGLILSAIEAYIYLSLAFILLILAGAAAVIITCVVVFLRFYRGMFGSEGYLAMTLPASADQIYLSKTIVATLWMIIGSVVTAISWFLAFLPLFRVLYDEMDSYYSYYIYEEVADALSSFFTPGVWIYLVVIGIVGFLSFIAQVYFCVTISNVPPFQSAGIAAAILAYIALQIVNQILTTALNYIIPYRVAYDTYTGWSLINQSNWYGFSAYSDFSFGIGANILPFLYAFALPVLTVWLINRKVNLK